MSRLSVHTPSSHHSNPKQLRRRGVHRLRTVVISVADLLDSWSLPAAAAASQIA
jgi:hypothetical protein